MLSAFHFGDSYFRIASDMAEPDISEKEAYFKEQDLLDLSDDETDFPDDGFLKVQEAYKDSKAMPPQKLVRQRSSFLGPTPKERQAEFEEHTSKSREFARSEQAQVQATSAPDLDTTKSFPITKPRRKPSENEPRVRLKKTSSLPEIREQIPFYKKMGVIPRELKNGKNAKPAENIILEPEPRQLLRGSIVYFYPNDDVSMPRRTRIHKVIQLGAAWVTSWRDDITHIIVDDAEQTYMQLLKHLNKMNVPKKIAVVKFEPYVTQSKQFGRLLDPTEGRFLVKGAPHLSSIEKYSKTSKLTSQDSLQVKPSRKQLATEKSKDVDVSVFTNRKPQKETPLNASSPASNPLSSSNHGITSDFDEIVEDSFIQPPSSPADEYPKRTQYNDAFLQAIEEAKAVSHLPIDEDDDGSTIEESAARDSDSSTQSETEDDAPGPASRSTKANFNAATKKPRNDLNPSAFQCMSPGNNKPLHNPNAKTIQILEDMCKYYDQMQDQWRTLAYRKAIGSLKKQETKITTAKEAAALPFVGPGLAEKVEEIVTTNRLRKLDNTRCDPTDKVLRLFLGVYGAGLSQANKWIQAGHRSLADLTHNAKITESQKIGIEHYSDFAARIPRHEVEQHGAIVREALHDLDPDFRVTIMGSYRRGAKYSGDIDLIITKPGTPLSQIRNTIFHTLVPCLFQQNFLKTSLATSSRHTDGTKWHGASCLPNSNTWRRIDLLIVPEEEMGAALLYFTGNDIFNRSMRLLASKKGMRLNQRGLYRDVLRGNKREKLNEGTLVEGRDEKKIFEVLGVPWREPEERIC